MRMLPYPLGKKLVAGATSFLAPLKPGNSSQPALGAHFAHAKMATHGDLIEQSSDLQRTGKEVGAGSDWAAGVVTPPVSSSLPL